jgi:hypothetical protein
VEWLSAPGGCPCGVTFERWVTPEDAKVSPVITKETTMWRAWVGFNASELTAKEREYLATAFEPADGARPYIKKHYDSRTPDGRLRGFLERSELPAQVALRPSGARNL